MVMTIEHCAQVEYRMSWLIAKCMSRVHLWPADRVYIYYIELLIVKMEGIARAASLPLTLQRDAEISIIVQSI